VTVPPLEPAPGLRPPAGAAVPHARPFALRLVAPADGVSRTVAHINNVEYVRWLDRAAELHCDALGWTRERMVAGGHMWFVARHEVDYRAEAFPGDELHVFTWVRTLGRSTSWRDTLVLRAGAFVDLATCRPARVPPEVRAAFEPLEAAACSSRSSSIPNGS
jgi:acyl-CoA thioester hydrolase